MSDIITITIPENTVTITIPENTVQVIPSNVVVLGETAKGDKGDKGDPGIPGPSGAIGPAGPPGTSDFLQLQNIPSGLVSSSAQISTVATASLALNAQQAVSASRATSAVTADTVAFNNITGRPTLVSSSAQVQYGQLSGIPFGLVSSSAQITYSGVSGIPAGIVSSSGQVTYGGLSGVPVGIISASSQVNYTQIQNQPTTIATASFVQNAVSASRAGTAATADSVAFANVTGRPSLVSASAQIDFTSIQNQPTTIPTASHVQWTNVANRPTGLVSASSQVTYGQLNGIPAGIVSSSGQVSFSGLSGVPSGLVSSSAQVTTVPTASFAVTAAFAMNGGGGGGPADWNTLVNRPVGIVSSSLQIPQVATSSLALTASFALTSAGTITNAATASFFSGTLSFPNGIDTPGPITASFFFGTASFAHSASRADYAKNIVHAPVSGTFNRTSWFLPNVVSALAAGTTALPVNEIRFFPFIAPDGGSAVIRQIGLSVTAGSALNATASVAIYSNRNGLQYPDALISSVRIPLPSNGVQVVTLSPTLPLVDGQMYWVGIHANSGSTVRSNAVGAQMQLGSTNFGTNPVNSYNSASNWGAGAAYNPAWPTTITTNLTEGANITMPQIGFRFGV